MERFVDYPQLGRFTLRDEGMRPLCIDTTSLLTLFNYRQDSGYWQGTWYIPSLDAFLKPSQITRLVEKNLEEVTDGVRDLSVGA